MTQIFFSLAVVACPVGMGLMMWFMMRGNKQSPPTAPTTTGDASTADPSTADLVRLRAEIDQLETAQREAKPVVQDSKLDR